MRFTYLKRDLAAGNPLASALVIVAGTLVIGLSIVLGFFALLALGAIVLVGAAMIGIRAWWLTWRPGAAAAARSRTAERRRSRSPGVIEGEYRVVRRDGDEA